MAQLAIQQVAETGLAPTFAAAAGGGDTVPTDAGPGKRRFLVVKNGGAGAITATIDSIQACSQGFDHNGGGSVPAGGERWYGPLTTERYGGLAAVTYSGVTSVTVAAVEV